LLSGLEAVEVRLSDALRENAISRIDSEYFLKGDIRLLQELRDHGCQALSAIARVTDGIHEAIRFDEKSGIRLLSARFVRENYFDFSEAEFISREHHELNPRTSLRLGDVIVSSTGTVGNCAVIEKRHLPANADRDVGIVRLGKRVPPEFVSTFLLSRFGRFQTRREATGSVQLHLFLIKFNALKIPCVSEKFMQATAEQVRESSSMLLRQERLIEATEELLFSGLGLSTWRPSEQLGCSRSACELFGAGRLDAEYFSPRYQSLLGLLRRQGKTLRDVARLREDVFTAEAGKPFHYIEIGDLSSDGAATSQVVAGEEAPSRATWIVQPGDVVTSTVRPIRCLTGLIEPEQAGHVCSSGFAVLTPKGIPSELLFAYLRLPVMCELMDLHTTASMYPAISTGDLMRLPFLMPDEGTIGRVKRQIRAARAARREAHGLLERAKRAVEVAIEESEKAGMAVLRGA
jgi:hypothetical protein